MKRMILTVAVAVAVALMIAGCGGGGGTKTVSKPISRTPTGGSITGLPSGHMLASGTLAPGKSLPVLDARGMRTTVSCPVGGAACRITVASDGTATYTGGRPTVATRPIPGNDDNGGTPVTGSPIPGLPSGYTLSPPGTVIYPAGTSRSLRDSNDRIIATISCPSSGAACRIIIASDGTATYTGGRPTFALAPDPGNGDDGGNGDGSTLTDPTASRSAWERDFLADWPSINNWSAFQGLDPWILPAGATLSETLTWTGGSFRGTWNGTQHTSTL